MSLKDNVNVIKEELSAEEQFLESVIKAEGFWKKYKKIFIALAVIVLVGLFAKVAMDYIHESNLKASNSAYSALLKDSKDADALATLKSKNPKLYELYLFKTSMHSGDVAQLEKSQSSLTDPILKDLLHYQIGSLKKKPTAADAGIAKELALLEEGYLLLQANKIKEADAKFAQISSSSSLQGLVKNLKHYRGN